MSDHKIACTSVPLPGIKTWFYFKRCVSPWSRSDHWHHWPKEPWKASLMAVSFYCLNDKCFAYWNALRSNHTCDYRDWLAPGAVGIAYGRLASSNHARELTGDWNGFSNKQWSIVQHSHYCGTSSEMVRVSAGERSWISPVSALHTEICLVWCMQCIILMSASVHACLIIIFRNSCETNE